ncbi:type II secretion system protein [Salmonella enterica]|uniref:type II secretion system protein n=1 Tax=Salmonella enterica TaxID=28901 RepID=UPI001C46E08A|nr:prepilin-type N-terminal cleavage/methylation domain-containing protein [Salmonella enterica]HCM1964622.1 prepilin-type N-terminal cleavage/methylation domain-containing protein [Salmonella enterica subsp. salamae serovar 56:l,v:z39]
MKKVTGYSVNQRGLTLIEAAMVLALSAIVISGVMYYYNATSESYQEQQTMEMIENIISKVNALYVNASSTEGLTTAVIATQIPGVKLLKQDGFDYIEIPGSKGGELGVTGAPNFAYGGLNLGPHGYIIYYDNYHPFMQGNSAYQVCMTLTGGQYGSSYLGAVTGGGNALVGGTFTLSPADNTVEARARFCNMIQKGADNGGTGAIALYFNAS